MKILFAFSINANFFRPNTFVVFKRKPIAKSKRFTPSENPRVLFQVPKKRKGSKSIIFGIRSIIPRRSLNSKKWEGKAGCRLLTNRAEAKPLSRGTASDPEEAKLLCRPRVFRPDRSFLCLRRLRPPSKGPSRTPLPKNSICFK